MWSLYESFGHELEPIADFAREDHARPLYESIMRDTDRHFRLAHNERGFPDSPHLWRVWAIGPRTGVPEVQLLAARTRAFAEAYMTDRRPVAEEWRLFYQETPDVQVSADFPSVPGNEPTPPPVPPAFYHAVAQSQRQWGQRVSTNFEIVASFSNEHAAQDYINRRPGSGLSLMRTAGFDAAAIMQPIPAQPRSEPAAAPPKVRKRAVRI